MIENTASTRRSFLKGGALLAAPLAAAAVPAAVMADEKLRARVARLENEAAIGKLHRAWLGKINRGATGAASPLIKNSEGLAPHHEVRRILAEHGEQPDMIELAADGESAVGRFPCLVEFATAIAPDCTLAQMARAQGGGFVHRTERRILRVEFVKASGAWAMRVTVRVASRERRERQKLPRLNRGR
jgi:hypothetical protein